ncbi:kinase-like protein [Pleomassaria siparia CBS 279.74]|uniref:Kinase-like protein n=1 Tax=Pleomassaria siparia CBS 279.74 TaxID=1314801 RepID=A0A6G1K3D1_9PLEO|nr:kinase-like protein [Pleomassaria siparia CBS 279.74]
MQSLRVGHTARTRKFVHSKDPHCIYARSGGGLWHIGNEWFLWDRVNNGRLGNDFITHQFLRSHTIQNIPLVEKMQLISEPTDKVQFTLMSRTRGIPLRDIWDSLSKEQKQGYRDQLIAALREMRQFTAPFPQRADGTPLHDKIIAECQPAAANCKSIGKTKEEWFNNIADELRYGISLMLETKDATIIQERFQQLQDNFPEPGTCVLTHGDLTLGNIIVDIHNGRIVAIIDWERAGFYPWWAERLFATMGGSSELLDPIWDKVCPDVDDEAFFAAVSPVMDVRLVWEECPIEHSEEDDAWFQRAFCECKPFGGKIYKKFLGAKLEHRIDYQD